MTSLSKAARVAGLASSTPSRIQRRCYSRAAPLSWRSLPGSSKTRSSYCSSTCITRLTWRGDANPGGVLFLAERSGMLPALFGGQTMSTRALMQRFAATCDADTRAGA